MYITNSKYIQTAILNNNTVFDYLFNLSIHLWFCPNNHNYISPTVYLHFYVFYPSIHPSIPSVCFVWDNWRWLSSHSQWPPESNMTLNTWNSRIAAAFISWMSIHKCFLHTDCNRPTFAQCLRVLKLYIFFLFLFWSSVAQLFIHISHWML